MMWNFFFKSVDPNVALGCKLVPLGGEAHGEEG